MSARVTRRFCRCPRSTPAVDADGVRYCERCEELVPEPVDAMLPVLIRHVAELERRVAALDRRLNGNGRAR